MTDPIISSFDRVAPTGVGLSRTLIDVFAATVARQPERLAIDAPDERLGYAALWDSASALGERLRALGIGPGDRVGVRVTSGTAELYVAILGVLHAGAAYVPVDADDPPARAAMVWEASRACAVIEHGLRITIRSNPLGFGRELTPHADAWVIFTSGSTGRPKGVAVTHRAAAAWVDAEAELWTIVPEDRVLAGLSVGFDASCEEMWLAWRNGAALVPAPRELVRAGIELGPWVADRGVTVISTVPTLAAMWDEGDIACVRMLILGGETCPEPLAWRLAVGREVWNTYGPTEATVVTTAAPLRPGKPVTIGRPLPGCEIAIVNEFDEPVAPGEPGELVIAGVGLGRYLDPVLDATGYAPLPVLGWERAYRTGDMVRETAAGLQFLGRCDDQVKVGGRRIELGEVEAQLSAVDGVRAAAAALQQTAAGDSLLVGYVVGDVDPIGVQAVVAERLPHGISPLVLPVDSLPISGSGKVDRKALPWPPPAREGLLTGTAAWLAERWAEQLGPVPIGIESDFFELGGSSLAAAKLASALRRRYPSVAVADIYTHRRLGELAARLDALEGTREQPAAVPAAGRRRWSAVQLGGVFALLALTAPPWLLVIFALNGLGGGRLGPRVGWGWLIVLWATFGTALGRASIVVIARRLLVPTLAPGRYPRRGWLATRLWFLDRLSEAYRSEALAGTPFAARFARLCGHQVGAGARLGTIPPVASLVKIGDGATLEAEVDLHGWWFEGRELVVGEVVVGDRARVGARALLAPGSKIGAGAEVEPGTVVSSQVPAGERWAGSPAARVGTAGRSWPQDPAPRPRRARFWRSMYGAGLIAQALLPLIAAAPGVAFLVLTGADNSSGGFVRALIVQAPILAASFVVSYAVLVALMVRATGTLINPGYHPDQGALGWAMWFSEALMLGARGVVFALFASLYTRPWLRLAGIPVGKRAELSTVVGVNRLTSFGETSFAADEAYLVCARARLGWLHVARIEVCDGAFLGNGAMVAGASKIGKGCTIGVLTTPPTDTPDGTSWLGAPALELPRVPDRSDPRRTIAPPRRLRVARGAMDLIRILLPATVSIILGGMVFWVIEAIAAASSLAIIVLATPPLLLAAGLVATGLTVAAKWLVIGRYRPGEHPLWSFFVWRDELLNSLQEQLAGSWLMALALGSPLIPIYLRAMGARVGIDVWCETLAITEFDVVSIGDGCVINRLACLQTHLFHDRLLRIGPTRLGARSTLGVASCILPDTLLGEGVSVGGRSVVLRGEELPPGTSWHGAPVVAV